MSDIGYARKVTAQVAVESIVNEPHGFDTSTMSLVLAEAVACDVAPLYVGPLRQLVDARFDQ